MSIIYVYTYIGIHDAVVSLVVCETRASSLPCMCDLSIRFNQYILVSWLLLSIVIIFDLYSRWIVTSCDLTSSFITLMLTTVTVHGIVCLNVSTDCSGGTRTKSSWKNYKKVLDVLPSRNANASLYVAAEYSCMRSAMEEKVSFHLSMYATIWSQPRSGWRVRTDWLRAITTVYHSLPLRVISVSMAGDRSVRWSGHRSSGVWRVTLTTKRALSVSLND